MVDDKKIRVKNFHNETVKSAVELMAAAGISDTKKLHRGLIYRRISAGQIQTYAETYPNILKGCLIEPPYPEHYEFEMANCNEETFEPLIK